MCERNEKTEQDGSGAGAADVSSARAQARALHYLVLVELHGTQRGRQRAHVGLELLRLPEHMQNNTEHRKALHTSYSHLSSRPAENLTVECLVY